MYLWHNLGKIITILIYSMFNNYGVNNKCMYDVCFFSNLFRHVKSLFTLIHYGFTMFYTMFFCSVHVHIQ